MFYVEIFLLVISWSIGEMRLPPTTDLSNLSHDNRKAQQQLYGPIHEAFLQPFQQDPAAERIITVSPPDPIDELPSSMRPDEGDLV